MSGGHFNYAENHLEYIAEQLEHDIKFNNVEYDDTKPSIEQQYGLQLRPETIAYLKLIAQELRTLKELLYVYDRVASGDSPEQRFLDLVRSMVPLVGYEP